MIGLQDKVLITTTKATFSTDSMLNKIGSVRSAEEGTPFGRIQGGSTSGSVRGPTLDAQEGTPFGRIQGGSTSGSVRGPTSKHYETASHHYEHINENRPFSENSTHETVKHYMDGGYYSFKKKSNPLFIKCSEDEQELIRCRRRRRYKCLFAALFVCTLVALAVTLTCWLYESNLESEMEKLRLKLEFISNEVDSLRNSSNGGEPQVARLQSFDTSRCQYKTKERGNSNQMEFTTTDFVPEANDTGNGVVTGVYCAVEGGTAAALRFTGSQYICNCTGKSQGESRFCKIHYWVCPKLV